jgi:hypothetical protein
VKNQIGELSQGKLDSAINLDFLKHLFMLLVPPEFITGPVKWLLCYIGGGQEEGRGRVTSVPRSWAEEGKLHS